MPKYYVSTYYKTLVITAENPYIAARNLVNRIKNNQEFNHGDMVFVSERGLYTTKPEFSYRLLDIINDLSIESIDDEEMGV